MVLEKVGLFSKVRYNKQDSEPLQDAGGSLLIPSVSRDVIEFQKR